MIRRFVRGSVPRDVLDDVAAAVATRYAEGDVPDGAEPDDVAVEVLDADNWLSTPMVVEDRWFVKVVTTQNALVHALFTAGRNLGAYSAGASGFFERFDTPQEMAEHELAATERMRDLGVNAPRPVEAFEHDGFGVLVLEFLPDPRPLDDFTREEVVEYAPTVFEYLTRMHEATLAHGDLRAENLLVADDELYFVDATRVRKEAIEDASAYDLACALAVFTPMIGSRETVAAALTAVDRDDLRPALEFLDFVNIRPDHDFDAATLKGELERILSE